MKRKKYFIMLFLLLNSLFTRVYASSSACIKSLYLSNSLFDYSFFKFIYSVFVFGVILSIVYVVTKLIAKKGIQNGKNKNLKIVESLPLSVDKSLLLVKVGQQYVLVGNTPKNIVYLSNIETDKLEINEEIQEIAEYDNNFESYIGMYKNDVQDNYFSSVKNNLNKLKSMVRRNKTNE